MTRRDDRSAPRTSRRRVADAKARAQELALAPFRFNAVCSLRELGVLEFLHLRRELGASVAEVAEGTGLSDYAATVLLQAALACDAVELEGARFRLSLVGHHLLRDDMTRVNVEFTRDVCYAALSRLTASLRSGKPQGLSSLGAGLAEEETVYAALARLPEGTRRSWLAFDHFYSQSAFPAAVEIVFAERVERLLDVGGNTGRFARACLERDPRVRVTIFDHPFQSGVAAGALAEFGERLSCVQGDLLLPLTLPHGFDAVWMSQLLDCLSERHILALLERARAALGPSGRLFVMEPCWDLQRHSTAKDTLLLLSLYFTCVANGESRMYDSATLERLLRESGYHVVRRHDGLGLGQSLFECIPSDARSGSARPTSTANAAAPNGAVTGDLATPNGAVPEAAPNGAVTGDFATPNGAVPEAAPVAAPYEVPAFDVTLRTAWDGAALPETEWVRLRARPVASELHVEIEAPFHADPAPSAPPGSLENLWHWEVVELFLLGTGERYLELEFGPHGHYWVLELRGPRCVVRSGASLGYATCIAGGRWRAFARVPFALLPPGCSRFNVTAIRGVEPARRHASWQPVRGERPDFHRLEAFAPFAAAASPG